MAHPLVQQYNDALLLQSRLGVPVHVNPLVVGGVAATVALGGILVWGQLRPHTWNDAGKALEIALLHGDASELLRYADKQELSAFGIERERVASVVQQAAKVFVGSTLTRGEARAEGVLVQEPWRIKVKGHDVPCGAAVAMTPDGPTVAVSSVPLYALRAVWTVGTATNDPTWKARHDELAASFSALGITGFWDRTTGKVMPWKRYTGESP
ncbi:MAG TPA: hypothetical protein PKA27_01435 [Fimbriimonadaceae bacterium]|nr:hypothetical protein [Fimbriimonadaceae bacterium]